MSSAYPFDNVKHKVILLGDSHVGKTSFVNRLCKSVFSENITPTIGSAFTQFRSVIGNKEHIFMIWDTAGEEKYRSMMPLYSQGAVGAFVVFDLTSTDSFEHIQEWLTFARAEGDIPVVLLGNKYDLEKQVSDEDISKFTEEYHLNYCECSALTGFGVENAFNELAGLILNYESIRKSEPAPKIETAENQGGGCYC